MVPPYQPVQLAPPHRMQPFDPVHRSAPCPPRAGPVATTPSTLGKRRCGTDPALGSLSYKRKKGPFTAVAHFRVHPASTVSPPALPPSRPSSPARFSPRLPPRSVHISSQDTTTAGWRPAIPWVRRALRSRSRLRARCPPFSPTESSSRRCTPTPARWRSGCCLPCTWPAPRSFTSAPGRR